MLRFLPITSSDRHHSWPGMYNHVSKPSQKHLSKSRLCAIKTVLQVCSFLPGCDWGAWGRRRRRRRRLLAVFIIYIPEDHVQSVGCRYCLEACFICSKAQSQQQWGGEISLASAACRSIYFSVFKNKFRSLMWNFWPHICYSCRQSLWKQNSSEFLVSD